MYRKTFHAMYRRFVFLVSVYLLLCAMLIGIPASCRGQDAANAPAPVISECAPVAAAEDNRGVVSQLVRAVLVDFESTTGFDQDSLGVRFLPLANADAIDDGGFRIKAFREGGASSVEVFVPRQETIAIEGESEAETIETSQGVVTLPLVPGLPEFIRLSVDDPTPDDIDIRGVTDAFCARNPNDLWCQAVKQDIP